MAKTRKLAELVRSETQRPIDQESKQPRSSPKPQPDQPPKYLTLVRKESRLREDQLDQLTALARKLNRQKKGGERITSNTLIRVAVDLLLSQSDELSGSTEQELRTALGLEDTE